MNDGLDNFNNENLQIADGVVIANDTKSFALSELKSIEKRVFEDTPDN